MGQWWNQAGKAPREPVHMGSAWWTCRIVILQNSGQGLCIGHACSEFLEHPVKPILWGSVYRVICTCGSFCCKCRNMGMRKSWPVLQAPFFVVLCNALQCNNANPACLGHLPSALGYDMCSTMCWGLLPSVEDAMLVYSTVLENLQCMWPTGFIDAAVIVALLTTSRSGVATRSWRPDQSTSWALVQSPSLQRVSRLQWGIQQRDCGPEMFHSPKIPERQRNGNGTGFQRVPIENRLNADVAPIADPFFQPLLAIVCRCWFNGHCWKCNGSINLLNLRLNLLNCNGFATGFPLQPVGHPLRQQRAPFLMTNALERSILALGTGATGD